MGNWTIRTKLSALAGFLLFVILIIGVLGMYGSKQVQAQLDNVSEVQMPAMTNLLLTDMIHDELKGIVYLAVNSLNNNDNQGLKDSAEEMKTESAKMPEKMKNLIKLDLHPETKKAIEESLFEVEKYVQKANEVVQTLAQKNKKLSDEKLAEFEVQFSILEKKLDNLHTLIEKDVEEAEAEGNRVAAMQDRMGLILMIASLLIGVVSSFLLIKNLNSMLSEIADAIAQSSENVASTATQMASSSVVLSQTTTEQASSLDETVASIEEIAAMVAKTSDNATTTATNSEISRQKVDDGKEAVEKMLLAMNDISDSNLEIVNQMNQSNSELTEIIKIIQEIESKTKVINEIVFQTKLLSFNASVEAARAGEHGKGFAVVAEEVGNLAEMSGGASKDITALLDNSIGKVQQIISSSKVKVDQLIEKGKSKVETGVKVAHECSNSLDEIVTNVQVVVELSKEISEATREQSQGVSEINKAMTLLGTSTQHSAAVGVESSQSAQNLSDQAVQLKTLVNRLLNSLGKPTLEVVQGGGEVVEAKGAWKQKQPTLLRAS